MTEVEKKGLTQRAFYGIMGTIELARQGSVEFLHRPHNRGILPLPRPTSPDLRKDWKIVLSATLAGAIEFQLMDPVTGKPRYGERSRLISALLTAWLAERGHRLPGGADLPADDLITQSMKESLNGPN